MTGYEILGLCRRINGVQFGAEDLTKEMEISRTPGGGEIRYAREQLIFAARARGIDSLDTPFTNVKDLEALEKDVDVYKRQVPGSAGFVHQPRRRRDQSSDHHELSLPGFGFAC